MNASADIDDAIASRVSPPIRQVLEADGAVARLGPDRIFGHINRAVRAVPSR